MNQIIKSTRLTPEQFVELWQSSQTFEQFLDRSGYLKTVAYTKARRLRSAGIPLQEFISESTNNWKPASLERSRERLTEIANRSSLATGTASVSTSVSGRKEFVKTY